MNHTNEIDGKSIDREEVDEIVIAQVNALKFIWKYLTFFFIFIFSFLQSTLFLVAGYDTTATTLTSSCFMLARNSEVQEKLYYEIMNKLEEHVTRNFIFYCT